MPCVNGINAKQDEQSETNALFRLDSEFEQECDDDFKVFAERFTSSFPILKKLPSPDPFVSFIKTYPSHKFCVPDESLSV